MPLLLTNGPGGIANVSATTLVPSDPMNELEAAARIVDRLKNPALYGATDSDVAVIETHISWVLLTGRFAYKFKKPVDLGFVDFTGLDRRRFFCEEELRLNRRLAPELYLDVVAITGPADAPLLDGPGEPIEYAVKMKQFSQQQLLSRLIATGQLLPAHVHSLACEVARFHSRIDVAGPGVPFGTPERVWAPVEENFRHLERAAGDENQRSQIAHLLDWSGREFAACRAAFERRKQGGFIRECHGDMHLGNMLLQGEAVTIFDCIEFNESLRWIDVLSEVAFCAMDLEDRGRQDLSHRFLNDYLQVTGDYEGLAVLRFYLVYRALVRAKVACLRLGQPGIPEDERLRVHEEFEGYLALAERYSKPRQPVLMITHGVSGSGKTTGVQSVVDKTGAIRIRSDVERKRLFGLEPTERPDRSQVQSLYSAEMSERTYATLERLALLGLRAGFSVVVDATFLRRSQRDRFRTLALRAGLPFAILDFRASDKMVRERLLRRAREGGDASDADVAVFERQQATREAIADDEQSCVIPVDSEKPADVESLPERVERTRHGT